MTTAIIPRAKTLPFVGDFYRLFFEDALSYFVGLQRRMGQITRFKLGPIDAVLVSDPDLVAQVLGRDVRTYKKGKHFDSTRVFLGNGIFVSEKDDWRQQRRMLNPGFTMAEVLHYGSVVTSSAQAMVDRWLSQQGRSGAKPLNIPDEMCHLAMEIIIRSMFQVGVGEVDHRYAEAVRVALSFVGERGRNPFALPMWVPLPGHQKFKRSTALLETYIYDTIAKARKNPMAQSLIQGFIDATDEDGKTRFTDEEIRDQVLTVFLAGHETTALALDWSFYLLDQHPAVVTKIRKELQHVTGGRDVEADDLPALKYTRQVGMESMRLYPPICFFPRESITDQKLGRYEIRKGDQIMLSPYITHRLASYWPKPDVFDPDRWEPEAVKHHHPFQYFPFSKGKRICMGQHFAMMEMVLVMATVMQKVDLKILTKKVKPLFIGTLRPNALMARAQVARL